MAQSTANGSFHSQRAFHREQSTAHQYRLLQHKSFGNFKKTRLVGTDALHNAERKPLHGAQTSQDKESSNYYAAQTQDRQQATCVESMNVGPSDGLCKSFREATATQNHESTVHKRTCDIRISNFEEKVRYRK
eukprot:78817-Amphidinium_carterae.1